MVRGYLDLKLIELKTQNIIPIHYIHMGKTLETSHFLKMVCSMGETKNIPYPFWKIHCSMGKMIHFTKNESFSVLLDH